MPETKPTFTLAELEALPSSGLNALAAEMRGWVYRETCEHKEPCWAIKDTLLPPGIQIWRTMALERRWNPVLKRQQSAELLELMVQRGVRFAVFMGTTVAGIDVWSKREGGRASVLRVNGNGALAETIAAIAAWFILEGRLDYDGK
jgi:hypothetical protein